MKYLIIAVMILTSIPVFSNDYYFEHNDKSIKIQVKVMEYQHIYIGSGYIHTKIPIIIENKKAAPLSLNFRKDGFFMKIGSISIPMRYAVTTFYNIIAGKSGAESILITKMRPREKALFDMNMKGMSQVLKNNIRLKSLENFCNIYIHSKRKIYNLKNVMLFDK